MAFLQAIFIYFTHHAFRSLQTLLEMDRLGPFPRWTYFQVCHFVNVAQNQTQTLPGPWLRCLSTSVTQHLCRLIVYPRFTQCCSKPRHQNESLQQWPGIGTWRQTSKKMIDPTWIPISLNDPLISTYKKPTINCIVGGVLHYRMSQCHTFWHCRSGTGMLLNIWLPCSQIRLFWKAVHLAIGKRSRTCRSNQPFSFSTTCICPPLNTNWMQPKCWSS